MHTITLDIKAGTKNQNCMISLVALEAVTFHDAPLHSMAETDFNTGGDADYFREGEQADVQMTLVAGTIGQHVDFGWIELDASAENGMYQFGIPDAALDHGSKWVDFIFNVAVANLGQMVHLHINLT